MTVSSQDSAGYKRLVLTLTSIGMFMAPLDSTIVNVSLPTMASSLHLDYATLIWVPTAYLVSFTVLPLTMGRLSDLRGRKPVYVFGVVVFSVFSFLCSLSSNGLELVAFRALQGVGAGSIAAVSTAIVADVFPRHERGKAIGINAMTVYIGLAAGPSLGGILTYFFGWRSIFYVNVPIGVGMAALAILKLKEPTPKASGRPAGTRRPRFDMAGVLLFTLGLVSLLVALTLSGVYGLANPGIGGLLALALVSIPLFVLVEARRSLGQRAPVSRGARLDASSKDLGEGLEVSARERPIEPMLDTSLFTQNRLFAAANLSALLNYTSYYCVSFLMAFYLQRVVGYTSLQAGIVLLAMPATMAVVAPICGWLSDRIGSRLLSSLGMALVGAGLLMMGTLGQVSVLTSSPAAVTTATEEAALFLFTVGLGMGMFSAPNTNAVMGSVEQSKSGVASGTLSTMRYMGQSLSLAIMGAIVASVASNAVVSAFFVGATTAASAGVATDLFLTGMREALVVAAAISVVGVFTSLVRGPRRPAPQD